MNRKSGIFIIFAMITGALLGALLGPTIVKDPSAFFLGMLGGVLVGWIIATVARRKSI